MTLATILIPAAIAICAPGVPRVDMPNCIVDGDTIRIAAQNYRFVDIDTPELSGKHCGAREKRAARAATTYLQRLVNGGEAYLHPTGKKGSYSRPLARVVVDGRDVGEILIAAGHARYWPDGPRVWCK